MRAWSLGVLAIVGLGSSDVLAQGAPEPSALELPLGARARVRTAESGGWIEGTLASADARTIALVPAEAPPLGANQLRLPSESVARLEVLTGKKSRWLPGLVVGAAIGVAAGFDTDVDPVQCEVDDNYFCSRTSAVIAIAATSAALGALVGNLVKTDVWTPVALDALGPPRERGARAGLGLRPVPGGVAVAMSVQF
jgi:hypothetical protein